MERCRVLFWVFLRKIESKIEPLSLFFCSFVDGLVLGVLSQENYQSFWAFVYIIEFLKQFFDFTFPGFLFFQRILFDLDLRGIFP
jgi:hypothetical protein